MYGSSRLSIASLHSCSLFNEATLKPAALHAVRIGLRNINHEEALASVHQDRLSLAQNGVKPGLFDGEPFASL